MKKMRETDQKQRLWKKEYLEKKAGLSQYQIQLLKEGPKSLTQAWALQAMKYDYNKYYAER